MTDKTIDLLITFFEQECDYTVEVLERDKYTLPINQMRLLKKRIEWFNTLIGTLKEAKTEAGIKMLKEAIEREKERKANPINPVIKCANCGNEKFYNDPAPNNHTLSIGNKYICTKCGFKATKELHQKRNMKKVL